jgi:hypothetical protein
MLNDVAVPCCCRFDAESFNAAKMLPDKAVHLVSETTLLWPLYCVLKIYEKSVSRNRLWVRIVILGQQFMMIAVE